MLTTKYLDNDKVRQRVNVVVVRETEGVGEETAEQHAHGEKVAQMATLGHEAGDEHAKGVGDQEARVEQAEEGV